MIALAKGLSVRSRWMWVIQHDPIQRMDPRTPPVPECVLTHAAHAAGIQLKILGAVAEVAAGGVDTQAVDAVHRICTLIHICGVGAPSAGILPSQLTSLLPFSWGVEYPAAGGRS